jgi:medium-chain acyl-[acyl-carrier-protein] hydrolase
MIYSSWKKLLHSSIEVIPLELTGRGGRMDKPYYKSIAGDGTDDLYQSMHKYMDGTPFAIFGHSMGTLFAYEISHKISKETGQMPEHIFFSGRGAPHTNKKDRIIHNLPESDFQEEVLQLGGTSAELFEHKELRDIYLPILRSDYRLVETYEDDGGKQKLVCDITALWGNQDRYSREESEAWKVYTSGQFRLAEFNGGHFFINQYKQQVIDLINQTLLYQTSRMKR